MGVDVVVAQDSFALRSSVRCPRSHDVVDVLTSKALPLNQNLAHFERFARCAPSPAAQASRGRARRRTASTPQHVPSSPTAATPLLRAAFPLLLRAAALHATPSPTPQSASTALLSRRRPRQSRTCRRRRRGGTGPRHAAGRSRRIWQPHRCVPLRVPAARATGAQPFWLHRPLHAAPARRRR